MIEVTKHGVLLKKTNLEFESRAVLNPAVIEKDQIIHLFYRAVDNNHISSIGHCILSSPLIVTYRNDRPIIVPEYSYESKGMEDPRISMIDGLYFLTYTAFDGVNAMGALATSSDLLHFTKKGIIVPQINRNEFCDLTAIDKAPMSQCNVNITKPEPNNNYEMLWDKDLVFFSRKINGKFYFLHRLKPDIQIASVLKLSQLNSQYWKDYFLDFKNNIVISPMYMHEASYIGAGCPPIETVFGWILIYHGVHKKNEDNIYSACVALLDLNHPEIEIARLPYPLFSPNTTWETQGEVNNVCFPTGSLLDGDTLYIYYGAADKNIACASLNFPDLILELIKYK